MPVDLYEYRDFRAFVRAWLRSRRGRPSQNQLADRIGISKAMVSSILSGKRDLDATAVGAWAEALGLDDDEARFFAALVDLDSPSKLRRYAASSYVRAAARFRGAHHLDDRRVRLFAHWHLAAVLELAGCAGFRAEPDWIADRLRPPITATQAAEALAMLVEDGLLIEREGTLVPVDVATPSDIPPGVLSAALRGWYLDALDRAADALVQTPPTDRHYSTWISALPSSALPLLRQRLDEMQRELLATGPETASKDRVYQLAIAFFPVSEPTR